MGDCGSVGSRSIFPPGGWRFNPRPSPCVLEQGASPRVAPCSRSPVCERHMIVSLWIKVVTSVLVCCPSASGGDGHLLIAPQSPVLEIGTNFTATCVIADTDRVTADDLSWNLSRTTVPRDQYAKINESALAVTVPVVGEKSEWLFCLGRKASPNFHLDRSKFIHGILLTKGCRLELCSCFKRL